MRQYFALWSAIAFVAFVSVSLPAFAEEEDLLGEVSDEAPLAVDPQPETVQEPLPELASGAPEAEDDDIGADWTLGANLTPDIPDSKRIARDKSSDMERIGRRTWKYRQGGPSSIFHLD